MRRSKRAFLLIAAGVVTGVVVATACGFPDPGIVADALLDEAGTGSEAGDDVVVVSDAPVTIDGQSPDAFIVEEDAAGTKVDAAGCDATCDCDKDGFYAPGHATLCADAGKQPGDCDD